MVTIMRLPFRTIPLITTRTPFCIIEHSHIYRVFVPRPGMHRGLEDSVQTQVQKHRSTELAGLVPYIGFMMGVTTGAPPFRRTRNGWMGALTRGQHLIFFLRSIFSKYAHAKGYIIGLLVHLTLGPLLIDAYCSTPHINSLHRASPALFIQLN